MREHKGGRVRKKVGKRGSSPYVNIYGYCKRELRPASAQKSVEIPSFGNQDRQFLEMYPDLRRDIVLTKWCHTRASFPVHNA